MKNKIDAIYFEVTGKDISQESQLEFHPAPEGGHMFMYLLSRKGKGYGFFRTPEEFRALLKADKPKKETKAATKKVSTKKVVKKVAKKAVKKTSDKRKAIMKKK